MLGTIRLPIDAAMLAAREPKLTIKHMASLIVAMGGRPVNDGMGFAAEFDADRITALLVAQKLDGDTRRE